MPPPKHIYVRDARDRLIDLLGFGETYPLQDLEVKDERLTVPINGTAKIPIDPSQPDVRYLLRKESEATAGAVRKGTGEQILLETPKITKDITYKVLARKTAYADPTRREDYLHQTATVKVGLDTTLSARIDAPTLDPLNDIPAATDPRIVDFGARVRVWLEQSQEGVDYSLVREPRAGEGTEEIVLSETDVRGDRGTIELFIARADEDMEIRIRATKRFVQRATQTDLLDVVLRLRVRADPAPLVSADPAPVVAFEAGAAVKIAGSQKSVHYRLYGRALSDRDFVYGEPGGSRVLSVPVGSEPDTQVLAPPRPEEWQVPEGFGALGEARPGTGGDLRLPLESLRDDLLVVVQARKEHRAGEEVIPSELQLGQAVAILVQPDPAPGLALEVPVSGKSTNGRVRASGGQPGVFYHFRRGEGGTERGLPAYFHKLDEADSRVNKGLNQLRMGVDFVVARDRAADGGELPGIRPLEPVVDLGSLPLGITLHVRAVKARSRVAVPLRHNAALAALPEIKLEQATLAAGTQARILIVASKEGQRYQPFLDGEPVKQARNGNGEDLVFLTDALERSTTIDLVVTAAAAEPIPVTQIVQLEVTVIPRDS